MAVVDDHVTVRKAIGMRLGDAMPGVSVVATVSSVEEVPVDPSPDVVILDLMLEHGESFDALPSLLERGSKVVLYTSEERGAPLRRAVGMGVSGVLLKGDPLSEIVEAVTMALEDGFYVSGPLAHALVTDEALVASLSDEQRQVLQCIDEGLDYRATARVLNTSVGTVKDLLVEVRGKKRAG